MSRINDGGLAFPCDNGSWEDGEYLPLPEPGMSLRQWYAGHSPILSAAGEDALWGLAMNQTGGEGVMTTCKTYMYLRAELDLAYADAMIAHESAEEKQDVPE